MAENDSAALACETQGLWATYPGSHEPVLCDVSISIPRGCLVGVVGPNGGGKSTLLKVALGLLKPTRGEVRLLGRPSLQEARARVGYVPQTELVNWQFPVTVLDVALMGRYARVGMFRRPVTRDRDAAREALERVGMLAFANRQIGELSGGQQQRVFLARAIASEPELLLLDEPMNGVDARTEADIFDLLDAVRDQGISVLMTTHDLSCVADRFDRVLFLNRSVIAYGAPSEVFTDDNLRQAYGDHLVLVKVGERYVAVEGGAHHGHGEGTHDRAHARAL